MGKSCILLGQLILAKKVVKMSRKYEVILFNFISAFWIIFTALQIVSAKAKAQLKRNNIEVWFYCINIFVLVEVTWRSILRSIFYKNINQAVWLEYTQRGSWPQAEISM